MNLSLKNVLLFATTGGLVAMCWVNHLNREVGRGQEAANAALQLKLTSLEKQLAVQRQAVPNALALAAEGGPSAESEEGKTKAPEKNPLATLMKGLGELMKSKEAQAGIRELTKGTVKFQFQELFDLLNLDEAQKEAATEILQNLEVEQQAAGMAFLSGKTKEEMKLLAESMVTQTKAAGEQLKALLGEANFKNYSTYTDSKPEREQLAMLRGNLKSTEHPLSEEQEQQVLDVLYRERKAYPWKVDYSNDREWAPEKMELENLDGFLTEQEAFDASMEQKLQGVLNQEQLSGFQNSNEQRRGMTKLGIGMMKGFLKNE